MQRNGDLCQDSADRENLEIKRGGDTACVLDGQGPEDTRLGRERLSCLLETGQNTGSERRSACGWMTPNASSRAETYSL